MGVAEAIVGSTLLQTGVGLATRPDGIKAPPSRSYLGEMQSALNAQAGIQDQLIGLERAYTPQWQQLQKESMMGGMNALSSLYGSAMPMAGALGSQMANSMSSAYNAAGRTAMGAYGSMFSNDTQSIYNEMGRRALADLQSGYAPTAEQTRYGEQAARAAMAARGMSTGNQAIAQEILNNYNLSNARYQQNLANAQNYLTTSQNVASQAYSMYGQPLLAQIQQVSPVGLIAGASGYNASLGAKLFNPESQYNADVMGGNQSNIMNTSLANAQAQAGWSSGLMSGLGSIAGAGIGALGDIEAAKYGAPKVYKPGSGTPPWRRDGD